MGIWRNTHLGRGNLEVTFGDFFIKGLLDGTSGRVGIWAKKGEFGPRCAKIRVFYKSYWTQAVFCRFCAHLCRFVLKMFQICPHGRLRPIWCHNVVTTTCCKSLKPCGDFVILNLFGGWHVTHIVGVDTLVHFGPDQAILHFCQDDFELISFVDLLAWFQLVATFRQNHFTKWLFVRFSASLWGFHILLFWTSIAAGAATSW